MSETSTRRPLFVALLAACHGLTGCSDGSERGANAADHKNAEYVIAGKPVTLVDGVAEVEAAPGSAARVVTRYFGNELRKDLNGDGGLDVVFLLTQETGGSGTFFYVVAALATDQGYVGSHGVLLGDRIAPQTTESGRGNIVVVNYADRAPGEPFSTPPSLGKSIWLLLDPGTLQFGEVAQDFEGEADPSRMTLEMKTWSWIRTVHADGREIVPRQAGKFTVTFSGDGSFTATTDCNRMMGGYTAGGGAISFGVIASTRMFCADSQESDFASFLENARRYEFTSRGELVIALENDSGSVVFR
jgi:heat shock protein HslJ